MALLNLISSNKIHAIGSHYDDYIPLYPFTGNVKNNSRSERSELSSVAEGNSDVAMSKSPAPEMFQTEKLYTGMCISRSH